jgi:glutathione synthase/RimK-type ligase-like ATP-grasp enzyme
MTPTSLSQHAADTPFLGLAPFLRMSINGADLPPIGQEMLAQAEQRPDDANLWMNLSLVMQCLGQREIGLFIQQQALELQRIYHLAAAEQPARLRLLMLMVPGDLAANVPLECLLEDSDIDLDFYYVSPDRPLALPVPEHDVLLVAIGEADDNLPIFAALEPLLASWPKPVINAPRHIPRTGRDAASELLQEVPGLLMPPTLRGSRTALQAVAIGGKQIEAVCPGCVFPIIVRPVGSHGGHDLERIDSRPALADYLRRVAGAAFYVAPFIDYSGADGLFRKARIALIDGEPYVCHMAVSAHWMIHYVNAGMYEEAGKRQEEADFMASFAAFAERHRPALDAIYQRAGLDYLCIDCAETADGQLLIFEIDHAMVVHAMDPEHQFPYKQTYMKKVRDAFRHFLFRLTGRAAGERLGHAAAPREFAAG